MSDEELALYAEQMTRVKARIDHAAGFLVPPHTYPRVEAGLLQLRQALEAIMMSSLIANRAAVDEVADALRHRKHDAVYKLVRRLNPNFWPQPSQQVVDPDGSIRMEAIEVGFVSESDYMPTWGQLSRWLHAPSPFAGMPKIQDGVDLGQRVCGELVVLLNHHTVRLIDRTQLLACLMNAGGTGKVETYLFERVQPAS